MQWLVNEILGPVARRVGGQTAAALVALGMAAQHQQAVAAAVAWGIITLGEVVVSARGRGKLIEKAKQSWGKN